MEELMSHFWSCGMLHWQVLILEAYDEKTFSFKLSRNTSYMYYTKPYLLTLKIELKKLPSLWHFFNIAKSLVSLPPLNQPQHTSPVLRLVNGRLRD